MCVRALVCVCVLLSLCVIEFVCVCVCVCVCMCVCCVGEWAVVGMDVCVRVVVLVLC